MVLTLCRPTFGRSRCFMELRKCLHNSEYLDVNSVIDNSTKNGQDLNSDDRVAEKDISENLIVHQDFVSSEEELCLLEEAEKFMKRLRYEYNHWDNAIHGFRETERSQWNERNEVMIQRINNFAFPSQTKKLPVVHVLDLSEDGYIKPHIDSVRFCGETIAGLSLLSDSVMRLVNEKNKSRIVDVLLKRRSLYIMRGVARYDYTHEILQSGCHFKGRPITKKRRISIICRNEPNDSDAS